MISPISAFDNVKKQTATFKLNEANYIAAQAREVSPLNGDQRDKVLTYK
jgi:hypothetical protein